MLLSDTIAAFATSSASGAVAVLRLSGEKSLEILKTLTRKETFEPREATLVNIYDEGAVLDKALALYFKAPNSYTGQDIVEISLHASPYIKTRVLQNCFKLGARQARAGEFTMRAYLNGKMDLAQAQGVADIIASHSCTMSNGNCHFNKGAIDDVYGTVAGIFSYDTNGNRISYGTAVVDDNGNPISDVYITETYEYLDDGSYIQRYCDYPSVGSCEVMNCMRYSLDGNMSNC